MRYSPRPCHAALLGVLLAVGCGAREGSKGAHTSPPPSQPPGAAAGSSGTPDARLGEGPRITLSPDNVHIEYRVYGSGDPAVLLVHGWAGDENYWHAQLDALKAHYTVITLNLAGHGASGANRTDWSIANYAQDVAAVASQLPGRQLVLVGHSMGAAVALAATPVIGDRVIGVVAVEALRSVGEPPLTAREIERRVAPFDADFVGATRNLVSSSLFERGADPALVQKVAYNMSLRPPAVAVPSLRSLLSMDLAGLLPRIHVPVYAINSDLLPTDAARTRRSVRDFHLDVLDHTGHFLMLEDPARFNALLLQDLAAISAQAAH